MTTSRTYKPIHEYRCVAEGVTHRAVGFDKSKMLCGIYIDACYFRWRSSDWPAGKRCKTCESIAAGTFQEPIMGLREEDYIRLSHKDRE